MKKWSQAIGAILWTTIAPASIAATVSGSPRHELSNSLRAQPNDGAARFSAALASDQEISELRAQIEGLLGPGTIKGNTDRIVALNRRLGEKVRMHAQQEGVDLDDFRRRNVTAVKPFPAISLNRAVVSAASAAVMRQANNPLYEAVESDGPLPGSSRKKNGSEAPKAIAETSSDPSKAALYSAWPGTWAECLGCPRTQNVEATAAMFAPLTLPGNPQRDGTGSRPVKITAYLYGYEIEAFSVTDEPDDSNPNHSPYATISLAMFGSTTPMGSVNPICLIDEAESKSPAFDYESRKNTSYVVAECMISAVPGSKIQVGFGLTGTAQTVTAGQAVKISGSVIAQKVSAQFIDK